MIFCGAGIRQCRAPGSDVNEKLFFAEIFLNHPPASQVAVFQYQTPTYFLMPTGATPESGAMGPGPTGIKTVGQRSLWLFVMVALVALSGFFYRPAHAQIEFHYTPSKARPGGFERIKSDYIIIDSVYRQGIASRRGVDRVQFKVRNNDPPVVYTADQVQEFSSGGQVYTSFNQNGKRIFLLRVAAGNTALYRDGSGYLLVQEGAMVRIGRSGFRQTLTDATGCGTGDRRLSRVAYSNASLRHYIGAHNAGTCDLKSFPYRKAGLYAGYSPLRFRAGFAGQLEAGAGSSAFTAGVFLDLPLFKPENLYISSDLMWLQHNPLFYEESANVTEFAGMEISGICWSNSIKYFIARRSPGVYIGAGLPLAFLKTRTPTGLVQTALNGDEVTTVRKAVDSSLMLLGGIQTGIGLEIPLSGRMNFHLEARYQAVFGVWNESHALNYSGLFLLGGISF
jgi:hypothetical protein